MIPFSQLIIIWKTININTLIIPMKLTESHLEETDARLGDVELLRLGQVLQPLDVRGQAVAEVL